MFRNYIKIALTNILKYRTYSIINILGLTVGMVCSLLILLYIQFELSYDKYHQNADRIYRVTREFFNTDGSSNLHLGFVAPPLAPLLKNDFPQIEHAVRIKELERPVFKYQEKTFSENRYFAADPDFFKVFDFPFIQGDPETALLEPNNIVITESTAKIFFGNEEPINKILTIPISAEFNIDLKVTGVIKDIPQNSHFHFDILGSMKGLEQFYGDSEFKDWSSNNYGTYLLFPQNYDINHFIKQIPDFLLRHQGENANKWNTLHIWKLTDIHLHSHLDSEFESNGNIVYIYILLAIAILLLLIACINFMNLATARSATRTKEIGIRKVVGARRVQIIKQFLSESILISGIALLFSIVLINLLLPTFNNFVDVKLHFEPLHNPVILFSLIGIALLVGIIAGSYPALYLSKFSPATTLQSTKKISSGKSKLRCGLVIFQFTITIILFISLGIIHQQMIYCMNKDLGLNKNNMILLPATNEMVKNYDSFRTQLLQQPHIIGIAASKRSPGAGLLDCSEARIYDNQVATPLGFRVANVCVSQDFIDTYEIPIVAGRNFSTEYSTDPVAAFILNECAIKQIGWSSPEVAIGKSFEYAGCKGQIIGVVKDFHYESLHKPIMPIVFYIDSNSFNTITVKINPRNAQDITDILTFLQKIWKVYLPDSPFHYTFLDERFKQLYLVETKLSQIFQIFSSIAIVIACLGLFGLVTFMAEKKTKEIGIRKVVGASVWQILILLTKDFTKWIIVATLIACPIAWYVMYQWLQNFAYRIEMGWWMFLLGGGIALLIALFTVSWQVIRAAMANPVESLRYE